MSEDFNFVMGDRKEKEKEIATSDSPEKEAIKSLRESEQRLESRMIRKTATSGNPNVITAKMVAEARKLAESSKGLDIAAFQKKHHIYVMNVDELLKG